MTSQTDPEPVTPAIWPEPSERAKSPRVTPVTGSLKVTWKVRVRWLVAWGIGLLLVIEETDGGSRSTR